MTGTTDRFEAGSRIGDYVVDRELPARPGLVAYSAKHALLPRRARILSLHPAFAGVQTMSLQLMREACILEALRHPGVPRVFECGLLPDRRPWVATELIEGPTVASHLAEEGPLSVPAVLGLLADVSEILHHVHARGCVHRNLRPEVIARRPEGSCIVDWADAHGHESDGSLLVPPDTLEYQPPEVIAGEPADRRADVFALGAVAYEALAGARSAMSAARRFPGVPARLSALIDRMLAPDPLVRPTSAEVRAEALGVMEQSEVEVPPPSEYDAADVQVEDVELHVELADYGDGDADVMPPPREARLRWTPPPRLYQRTSRTQTRTTQPASPAGSYPAVQLEASSRTKTEEMPLAPEMSRTQTESMPVLPPEPEPPRAAAAHGKHAQPPRHLEPPRRKST